MMNKKRILIVGNTIAAVALVKRLHELDNCGEIFATGLRGGMPDYVNMTDIREENVAELLGFVIEKSVNLTIAVSKRAIKADIAGFFNANGQMIFAPDFDSAKQFIDEAATKKFLYKLKIPTSKFGVFEKLQPALDYLKTAEFPLVVKTVEPANERDLFACPTLSVANIAVNDLFFRSENKIVIEKFLSGHKFVHYLVTDGYRALSLGSFTSYFFSDNEDGGYLTKGSASLFPDFKVTAELEHKLMLDVTERILQALEKAGNPYLGVLGLHCTLRDEKIYVDSISPFIEDVDAQCLLNSLDENILSLFEACALGVFSDDYEFIRTNSLASASVTLFSRHEGKELVGADLVEEPVVLNMSVASKTCRGAIGTLTASGRTLTRAKQRVADEIAQLKIEGLKYRQDIIS